MSALSKSVLLLISATPAIGSLFCSPCWMLSFCSHFQLTQSFSKIKFKKIGFFWINIATVQCLVVDNFPPLFTRRVMVFSAHFHLHNCRKNGQRNPTFRCPSPGSTGVAEEMKRGECFLKGGGFSSVLCFCRRVSSRGSWNVVYS